MMDLFNFAFVRNLAGEGGGGTSDYEALSNLPSINGITLTGNKTSDDLDLTGLWIGTTTEYSQEAATIPVGTLVIKTDETGIDSTPTENSTNPVTSGGVYTALDNKVDKVNGKGLSTNDFTNADRVKLAIIDSIIDDVPKSGSTHPVSSGGVYGALGNKVNKVQGKGLSTEDFTAMYKAWLDVSMQSPLNHNSIFRGKDLTDIYSIDEMYSMINTGTFDDLFLGDYFTKSITTDIMTRFTGETFESGVTYYEVGGADPVSRTFTATEDTEPQSGKIYCTKLTKTENTTLMFVAFDYYHNMGDTALTTHHAILIPRGAGFATTAKMSPTNTTAGGYYGSDMHQITLPCYARAIKTALNNHLLSHKTWLTTTVNISTPSMAGAGMTGAASASAWQETELQLINEVQLYGSTVWSSSAYDVGIDNRKLPVFDYIDSVRFDRRDFWLRSIVSSTSFAGCNGGGSAGGYGASGASNVRPLIVFG